MLTSPALHNGPVVRRVGAALAAAVLGIGALAGCSQDDSSSETDSSPTVSATESASEPTESALPLPDGVELSAEGSQLEVGETATVAYEVKQGEVGVLDLRVTRLEKTSFKKSFVGWDLDKGQRKANPYFVRVKVTNRGSTDLGGRRVPLYIVDGTNTLVEATSFASAFKPCEPGTFPKKFQPGKKAKVCLVFLAPDKGELTAVSFRPTQEFDPITWTGELRAPKPVKPPKGKGKGGKGKGDQQPSDSPT